MASNPGKYCSAERRWAGVGPYYAMFPSEFSNGVVETYTSAGDTVIDLFAGRGTALYSAATKGRHAIGMEINPVGWVYASTKLKPAQHDRVALRVKELGRVSSRFDCAARAMPNFFRRCFTIEVLAYLLAARKLLNWRDSIVDRTVMALLLIDLHGKRSAALSNQMRQTKSMAPDYALRWWQDRNLRPPERDPVAFLLKKMSWRYAHGLPGTASSSVYLGDSTQRHHGLQVSATRFAPKGARLLFTSPPYLGITNYHYDQWLRLWLLGGLQTPRSLGSKHRGKFSNTAVYHSLLFSVFRQAKTLLANDATIYVRTDRREPTNQITQDVLKRVFPKHQIRRRVRPLKGVTQTRLFGNGAPTIGEVDLVLMPA